jgi:outer membrane receptor protein involved in Fe transport
LQFEWTEYKAMVSNRPQVTRGHGFFRYLVDPSNDEHSLKGRWGLDDDNQNGVAYNGHVKSYTIADWQTRWQFSKALRFTVGISNVFNTKPPLSLKVVGGNQVGYDGRYADPTGRAIQAGASYRF